MTGKTSVSYVTAVEVQARPSPSSEGLLPSGPVYRPSIYKDAGLPSTKTLYDNFVEAVGKYNSQPCIGHRVGDRYEYMTYAQAGEMAADIAGAMVHVGLKPHDRCSVFGANSQEWMLTMQACNRQTVYCVPLYDSLGDNTVDYIIDHSESSIVFVTASKLPVLGRALPKVLNLVKAVVYWGALDENSTRVVQSIRNMGVVMYSFQDFAQLGKQHPTPAEPPTCDDLCTIMYTSGTTGTPKGVLLTHRAVASTVHSLAFWFTQVGMNVGVGDVYLSFLPLAHIYDRVMEEAFLHLGSCIGYWGGDVRKITEDIKACQPTVFCSVPRVYERFYSVVMDKLRHAGFIKRALYNWAFHRKLSALKSGHSWDKATPRLDNMIFKAISKQMLGGRIRILTTGGAPIARHIEEFMRVVSCANFLQGYGLTETCAATFVTYPNQPDHFYTVGPPQPAFAVKLEAIPEMGYNPTGSPARGEVLVKGEGLFKGYYKNEEENLKALDSEGWFHTGDVGEFTATGALRIVDRKKNIFKLSQGEYIAVEKIEGVLLQSPLVEQLWVHGSHFESCLVAVVVPVKAKLEAWAKGQGVPGTFDDLCAHDQAKAMLLQEINSTGKKGGLKGFELPKAIFISSETFTVDNELVTPTFKLKRPQLLKRYTPHVEAMYGALKQRPAK